MARKKSTRKSVAKAKRKSVAKTKRQVVAATPPLPDDTKTATNDDRATELQRVLASEAVARVFGWDLPSSLPSSSSSSSSEPPPSNALTELLPGYVAPMKLDSSCGVDAATTLSESVARAQRTDVSTRDYHLLTTTQQPRPMVNNTKKTTDGTAGPDWFHMVSSHDKKELQADLRVIQNRNFLDPKKFYKSADRRATAGGVLQRGVVVEGTGEFYSNRYTNKERRADLTEELMADATVSAYAKKHFTKLSTTTTKSKRSFAHKKRSGATWKRR